MNALVELAFTEACLICTQLLHIRTPKPTDNKPLVLAPLGAPTAKVKPAAGEDSDSEGEEDDDDNDPQDVQSNPLPSNISEEARALALATHDAVRYSALCEDYKKAVQELESLPAASEVGYGPELPPAPSTIAEIMQVLPVVLRSELIDKESGKLSIALILRARLHWQVGMTTKSEKVSQINSKYALSRIARAVGAEKDDTNPEKMSLQEAANLTRVFQDQHATIQDRKPIKYREIRWKGIVGAV
ncbi:hypothetical protein GGX14DRAFT_562112 [Mycena pura]|uniref:Uncharacterized protein n=1 Tax=Mycena pura TaxID=153505 RepID=A0AAD6VLH8_9AGAR|nr:hypothetical protein GGX14DRAFT_562112 [Mycena pura]